MHLIHTGQTPQYDLTDYVSTVSADGGTQYIHAEIVWHSGFRSAKKKN